METAAGPSRLSRVDSRFRHRTRDNPPSGETVLEQEVGEEEELSREDEPLLIREQRGRAVMGEAHRKFHRRAAQQATNVLTVTERVVVQQTEPPPAPTVPTVPAVPTDPLPTVPAVPPFPSDLTPPAYPWPSGVPGATPSQQSTDVVPAATTPTIIPSTGYNSTISSAVISSTSLSLNSTSLSSTPSSTRSSTSSTRSSTSSSSATSSTVSVVTSSYGGGGGFNPLSTAAPPAVSSPAAANTPSDSTAALRTPEVVGTVFGSLAGAALLLALLLFLLRRHKQKQSGTLQLSGEEHTDEQPMAQTVARNSFIPPSFLNRFSGASRSTAESSGTGERSFQRVSGRKLPSAFSEGMTSEQFARDGTLSGSSFYQDDKGFYGGTGVMSKDFGKEIGDTSHSGAVGSKERVMPSPARTPVIHHSDDDSVPWGTPRNGGGLTLSPPLTPNPSNPFNDTVPPPRGSLGRSHPSHDGSRSSRFTENV